MMLRILFILFSLSILFGFTSCISETESGDIHFDNNPLKDRHLIYSFTNEVHQVQLYSRDSILYEGYNDILLRIKDQNDKYLSYVEMTWTAITTDSIIAPKAEVTQSIDNPDIYKSFLIFPKDTHTKNWHLNITYQIQSTSYTIDTELRLFKSEENRVTIKEKLGADNKEYLLVLTDPYNPINGFNNCSLMIYEKQDFSVFKIRRNLNVYAWCSRDDYIHDVVVELPFQSHSDRYQNKLEIIDLGIWRLNVVVKNEQNNIILGEEKSANQLTSSLHFPLATDSF